MAGSARGWLAVGAIGAVGAVAATIAGRRGKQEIPVREGGDYRTVRVVTVNRPTSAVQELIRDAGRLSAAVDRPVTIEPADGERWRVRVDSADGAGWVAEVSPAGGDAISWRVADGPHRHEARAEFAAAPGGRGTEIRVELTYPQGPVGHQFAVLRGQDPDQALRTVLRRAKSLIEAGQVVSTMHEPSGRGPVAERATHALRERLAVGGRS
jgi:uncharacterized membrane protein